MKIKRRQQPIAPASSDSLRAFRLYKHRLTRRDLLQAHFRPAFYRYFQTWYRQNQHRFALPLHLSQRRQWGILLSVGEIPAEKMHFYLTYKNKNFQDGCLNFFHGLTHIDHLVWMETYPKYRTDGVVCRECHRYISSLRNTNSEYELEWLEKEAGNYSSHEAYFEDKLRPFRSVEALWDQHIFEVILETVNKTISTAERIELLNDQGFSFVRFLKAGEQPSDCGDTPVVDVIWVDGITESPPVSKGSAV